MKTNYFLPIMLAASLLFNCKGKDGAPGPVGATGPMLTEENYIQEKEGYMKATLTGTIEGKPETFNFDFQGIYGNTQNTFQILSDTQTAISISKYYAKDGDLLQSGRMDLDFTVGNLLSLSKKKITRFSCYATKEISPLKILQLDVYGYASSNSFPEENASVFALTDLKYNPTNNIIEGKFTATIKQSIYNNGVPTYKTSTITNGSFSTKLVQEVTNTRKSN